MGNSFQVEVCESQEELQHRLHHAVTATTKERLQMLYWIKVGAIATRQELSQASEEMNQQCIVGCNGISKAV
ncbi:hypothetical protein [Nostoc sp.]|uniref:hypothetical protein n=1 Tax=Nostoc sp. TaxID=1180 RepID=UPI002FF490B0